MLPNLRFAFTAAIATVVLMLGAVALMASRMPVSPLGPHVMRERVAPLALIDGRPVSDFENRTATRRSDELTRLLSIQIGPAGARAGEPPAILRATGGDQEAITPPSQQAPTVVAATSVAGVTVPPANREPDLGSPDQGSDRPLVVAALPSAASEVPVEAAPVLVPVVATEPLPALVLVASLSVAEPRIMADFDLTAAVTLPPPAVELPAPAPLTPASVTEVASLPAAPEMPEATTDLPASTATVPDVESGANSDAPSDSTIGNLALPAAVPLPPKRRASASTRPRHAAAVRPAPPKRVRVAARPVRPHPRAARKPVPVQRTAADPNQAYWQRQQQWWGATQQPRAATRASRRVPGRSEAQ